MASYSPAYFYATVRVTHKPVGIECHLNFGARVLCWQRPRRPTHGTRIVSMTNHLLATCMTNTVTTISLKAIIIRTPTYRTIHLLTIKYLIHNIFFLRLLEKKNIFLTIKIYFFYRINRIFLFCSAINVDLI